MIKLQLNSAYHDIFINSELLEYLTLSLLKVLSFLQAFGYNFIFIF